MLDKRWIQFLLLALVFLGVEYKWPLDKRKTLFREGFFQDIFFWIILVDFYFFPLIEAHFEGKFHEGYAHFFSLGETTLTVLSVHELPDALQIVIVFLVMELINYFAHRYIKHSKHFWDFHKTHHSSKQLNQFSDTRNHPFLILFETFFLGIPVLIILNPNALSIGFYSAIGLVWGPLIHMNIRLKWPAPLSYILSSPHTHRWHHSREQGVRCNYAGIFIFYDVLFRSYYSPQEVCSKTGFINDEDFPQSPVAMLLYPFQVKYNKFIKSKKLTRK